MRKYLLTVCSLMILLISFAVAGEDDLSFELTADFFSKYIWRGQNLNDDPVFQTGASATYKKLTFGIWGNLDFTNINDRGGDFSEVDSYIDFSDDLPGFEGISYSVGAVYYNFPGHDAAGGYVKDTTEVYWGLGFDTLFSPTLTVYHDVDEASGGAYANLGFSYSYEKIAEIGDIGVGMDIGLGLGWANGSYNKYYWSAGKSRMQDLALSVSFPMEVAGFTVAPSVNYVTLLSSTMRDTDAYNTGSDYLFCGVSISKTF